MSDSTSSSKTCANCGAPIATAAPEGLCPRCVAALNFGADTAFTDGGSGTAQMPSPTPGELAPHFPQLEIIECLGRGGMGVVYKARQTSLGRFVALKLLAPERVSDGKFAERFAQEAKALAALNHPNIVAVHDFGVVDAVTPQPAGARVPHAKMFFLLMEFVDGVNLRQAMKAGRFTPEQALAIVPPVCEALQYAHEHGIVHRDIKPENLLLDKEGRVKIADFGIAKMLGESGTGVPAANADSTAGTTEPHSIVAGTPQYMAPEQKAHRATDHRADIYSLGVVLYELLTGELPADSLQPPSRKVQIDVRLDEIVLRALEKTPELRFATATEFRTRVETMMKASEAPNDIPASPHIGYQMIFWAIAGHVVLWLVRMILQPIILTTAGVSVVGQMAIATQMVAWALSLLAITGVILVVRSRLSRPKKSALADAPRMETIAQQPAGAPDATIKPQPRWQGCDVWVIGLCLALFGALWLLRLSEGPLLNQSLFAGAGVGSNVVLPVALATTILLAGAAFLYMLARNIKTAAPTRTESWKRTVGRSVVPAIAVILLLRTFVIHPFVVPNNSMSPEITKGSRILVWKLTSTYAPGDIVAYRHEDKIWVARVTQVGPTTLTLQKNSKPNSEVQREAVIGKVISVFWRPSPGADTSEVPPPYQRFETIADPLPAVELKVAQQQLEKVLAEIEETRGELPEVESRYTARHPKMMELVLKLKALEEQAAQLRATIRKSSPKP